MLVLLAAFAGIVRTQVTGLHDFYGSTSILISLILVGTAIWLAYETQGCSIGESANRAIQSQYPQIERIFIEAEKRRVPEEKPV